MQAEIAEKPCLLYGSQSTAHMLLGTLTYYMPCLRAECFEKEK